MKKLIATILVLTMVLALTATATAAAKLEAGQFVKLRRNAYAYTAAKASKITQSVAAKGSHAYVVKVVGNYVKVLVNSSSNKAVFFKASDVKPTTSPDDAFVLVYWVKGGQGMSKPVKGSETADDGVFMISSPNMKTIKVTGKTTLRTGYSLSNKAVATVKKYAKLKYLRRYGIDDRGVMWYKVRYNKANRWISSYFAKVVN